MVEPHLIINLLVPTQAVGLLIGKNGSAFRNINQATGININFQSTEDIPDQNFQRVLCLRGESYHNVLAALSMVIEKLHQPRSVPGAGGNSFEEEESCSSNQQILKWVIPQGSCGVLIGRGGEGIRRINDMSGAWVKVAHIEEFRQNSAERLVYIRGTPEQALSALQTIRNKVGGRRFEEDEYIKKKTNVEGVLIPIDAFPFVFSEYLQDSGSQVPTNSEFLSPELLSFLAEHSLKISSKEAEALQNASTSRSTSPSVTAGDILLHRYDKLTVCGCDVYFEPRLDLGARYVFAIIVGEPDQQAAATNAMQSRLHLWQSVFDPVSHAMASATGYSDIPRLTSLPTSSAAASSGNQLLAGSSGQLVGVTLLIYSATSNYFDFDLLDRGGDDSCTEKQLKFVSYLKEFCLHSNCLLQLLPISHIPLSKRHDLRRISLLAPNVSVLLDVLALVHKMIAVFVPFDVCVMPNLPLQGDATTRNAQNPVQHEIHGVPGLLGRTANRGVPEFGFDPMSQYGNAAVPGRYAAGWEANQPLDYASNGLGQAFGARGTKEVAGYHVVDDYAPTPAYQTNSYAAGANNFQQHGPAYRGNLVASSPLSGVPQSRSNNSGGYYNRQSVPAPRSQGFRQGEVAMLRSQPPLPPSQQLPYYANDMGMGSSGLPSRSAVPTRDIHYSSGISGGLDRSQFAYNSGMQAQPIDRRYGNGVPAAAVNRGGQQQMSYMHTSSMAAIPGIQSMGSTGISSVTQVPYFIPNVATTVTGMSAPRSVGPMNALGQDDLAGGYAFPSQYTQQVADDSYMRNLNQRR